MACVLRHILYSNAATFLLSALTELYYHFESEAEREIFRKSYDKFCRELHSASASLSREDFETLCVDIATHFHEFTSGNSKRLDVHVTHLGVWRRYGAMLHLCGADFVLQRNSPSSTENGTTSSGGLPPPPDGYKYHFLLLDNTFKRISVVVDALTKFLFWDTSMSATRTPRALLHGGDDLERFLRAGFVYPSLAFNANALSATHYDSSDSPYVPACIVPFGHFEGGELHILPISACFLFFDSSVFPLTRPKRMPTISSVKHTATDPESLEHFPDRMLG